MATAARRVRVRPAVAADNDAGDDAELLPLLLAGLLSRRVDVADGLAEFAESRVRLQEATAGTLLQLADFCHQEADDDEEELQLAATFEKLLSLRPSFWMSLLRAEVGGYRPLEFAALRRRFRLAAAFMSAPGHCVRSSFRPGSQWQLEVADLTDYRCGTGRRYFRSPFVLFVEAAFQLDDEAPMPAAYLEFLRHPVTVAYVNSNRMMRGDNWTKLPTSVLFYLLFYLLVLFTVAFRIFTADTFDPDVSVRIAGYDNDSASFFETLPAGAFAAARVLLRVRFVLQAALTLLMSTMTISQLLYHFSLPPAARQPWFLLRWAVSVLTFDRHMYRSLYAFAAGIQAATLAYEWWLINSKNLYSGSGRQLYIEPYSMLPAVMLYLLYMMNVLLQFLVGASYYWLLLFNLVSCLSKNTVFASLLFVPIVMFAGLLLLTVPYESPESESVELLLEYVAAAFRLAFGFPQMSATALRAIGPAHLVMYYFIGVFLLNFGIAMLSQRVAEVQTTLRFRQRVALMSLTHQVYAAQYHILRAAGRLGRKPLLLRRRRLRLAPSV